MFNTKFLHEQLRIVIVRLVFQEYLIFVVVFLGCGGKRGGKFVCVDVLHPSQQFFSHVRMISCLPGLNQYKAADKVSYSRTKYSDW